MSEGEGDEGGGRSEQGGRGRGRQAAGAYDMPSKRGPNGETPEDQGRLLEPGSSREEEDVVQVHHQEQQQSHEEELPEDELQPEEEAEVTAETSDRQRAITSSRSEEIVTHRVSIAPSQSLGAEKLSDAAKRRTGTPQDKQQRAASRGSSQKHRDKSPQEGGKASAAGIGRGSSPGQPLQRVVYYQNRFITIPVEPGQRVTGICGSTEISRKPKDGLADGTAGKGNRSGAGMDPIQLDGPSQGGNDRSNKRRGLPSCIKKIAVVLEDNRLQTGGKATADKIRDMNQNQDESNPILKKILNIIFVTTGVALFLAVIVVIIYTGIGERFLFRINS